MPHQGSNTREQNLAFVSFILKQPKDVLLYCNSEPTVPVQPLRARSARHQIHPAEICAIVWNAGTRPKLTASCYAAGLRRPR